MPPHGSGCVALAIGPAGSGKTAAALAEYGEALRRFGNSMWEASPTPITAGGPHHVATQSEIGVGDASHKYSEAAAACLWIAPTRNAAAPVRERLAGRHPAVLGPGVTTFGGLAAEVVRDAGLLLTPINPQQRRRLLRRIIDEAAADSKLEYYAPVAATPGLVGIVDEAITQLQRRGLSPADVEPSGERADDARARDLALVYAQYCVRLAAGGLIDAATLLTTAADALAKRPSQAADLELVVIDGFASFSVIELRLLEQLAQRARRMLVTLPGDSQGRRDDLFAKPLAAAKALGRLLLSKQTSSPLPSAGRDGEGGSAVSGQSTRTSSPLPVASQGLPRVRSGDFGSPVLPLLPPHQGEGTGTIAMDGQWPALAHLERNLFRIHGEVEPPSPAVEASLARIRVIAASGVQAEVVEIARRVKGLLNGGVAPGDVVVAFRSVRESAERVRQTFDDFGIPVYIEASRRLAATALVRTLVGVLRLAAEDWPYRRVLQTAGDRSVGIFTRDNSESADDGADVRRAIEQCVRYAQLPSGRRALFGQLATWAADAERTSRPTPAEAGLAQGALGRLAAVVDVLPKRASIERWIVALGALANDLGLLHPATADTAANWAILARTLRAAARVDAATGMADADFSLAELIEIIATSAAQTPAAESNDAIGRVRVLSAESARLACPRHVFVAGLSEQSFPAPHRAAAMMGDGVDDAAEARSAEMLLFYQLVTRPTETLTLSYPALDERAQMLPPSPFLVDVERAFAPAELPKVVQPLNYTRHVVDDGETPLSRSELRRGAVGQALSTKRDMLAALATHSRGVGEAILAGIETVADRARRDAFGEFDGVLSSSAAAAALHAAYGRDHLWSPSRLERYAECPFLFFGEQLLHLEPLPELALASDVRRRGSLLHETLARLYAELQGASLDPEQLAAAIAERFHASLAAAAATRPGRGVDAAIREIERRQIAAWAEDFAKQDADYRSAWAHLDTPPQPAYFEARFGPASRHSESRGDARLSTDEPFRLTVSIGGASEPVQFAGQVDRIDVGRVGDQAVFNIIDYKTSARAMVRDAEIHAGRQIQLPLYALAVEQQLLLAEQAAALSAGFWSIRGKGFAAGARTGGPLPIRDVRDGALVAAPSWDTTREKLTARIGEIIASIRRGHFPVYNDNENCTQHCDLRTICRIAQIRSLDKQWTPPLEAASERSDLTQRHKGAKEDAKLGRAQE